MNKARVFLMDIPGSNMYTDYSGGYSVVKFKSPEKVIVIEKFAYDEIVKLAKMRLETIYEYKKTVDRLVDTLEAVLNIGSKEEIQLAYQVLADYRKDK